MTADLIREVVEAEKAYFWKLASHCVDEMAIIQSTEGSSHESLKYVLKQIDVKRREIAARMPPCNPELYSLEAGDADECKADGLYTLEIPFRGNGSVMIITKSLEPVGSTMGLVHSVSIRSENTLREVRRFEYLLDGRISQEFRLLSLISSYEIATKRCYHDFGWVQ
jgi:hypothetical protein